MYDRTISFYTFSKTYAMTGLRLGYVAAKDATLRDRMKKALFYTASNVSSVVQFGGIGALEGSQAAVAAFRDELQARRDLFYQGIREHAGDVFCRRAAEGRVLRVPARSTRTGLPPAGSTRRVAVVGDDGVPDRGGADRLRSRRGLRRERRGLSAFLLRARPRGTHRRPGLDERRSFGSEQSASSSSSSSRFVEWPRIEGPCQRLDAGRPPEMRGHDDPQDRRRRPRRDRFCLLIWLTAATIGVGGRVENQSIVRTLRRRPRAVAAFRGIASAAAGHAIAPPCAAALAHGRRDRTASRMIS